MTDLSVAKDKREGLDKQLIRFIGYIPTCLLSGVLISVPTSFVVYLAQYFDFSQNLLNQLDSGYDHLAPQLELLILPSLFGGSLVGLVIGVLATKLKVFWQRVLASSVIGLIVYLLASVIWQSIKSKSFFNSLDYLKFFALELSIVGLLAGLLIALLPQPENNKKEF